MPDSFLTKNSNYLTITNHDLHVIWNSHQGNVSVAGIGVLSAAGFVGGMVAAATVGICAFLSGQL